jgi:prophage regulatory protein
MKMLSAEDLQARGIRFCRQHRDRLIREGKFPRPVKLGAGTNAWPDFEIDEWLAGRIAARDVVDAARRKAASEPAPQITA